MRRALQNVVSALSMCTSSANSFACVCPTVVASGLACSSCLASVDADATDASFLGSLHNRCAATGTATTTDPCDAPCNNVVSALSTCTASADSFACACPTVVASGLACSSCLASVDADATDASFFGSLYTRCKSPTTMNAALTSTPTTQPTVPKTTTSTIVNSIATHPNTQSCIRSAWSRTRNVSSRIHSNNHVDFDDCRFYRCVHVSLIHAWNQFCRVFFNFLFNFLIFICFI